MRSTCSFSVEFPDEKSADAAMAAVAHEGEVGSRSKTKMTKRGCTLTIEIDAKDIVAMRATANAFMRALQVFEAVER